LSTVDHTWGPCKPYRTATHLIFTDLCARAPPVRPIHVLGSKRLFASQRHLKSLRRLTVNGAGAGSSHTREFFFYKNRLSLVVVKTTLQVGQAKYKLVNPGFSFLGCCFSSVSAPLVHFGQLAPSSKIFSELILLSIEPTQFRNQIV